MMTGRQKDKLLELAKRRYEQGLLELEREYEKECDAVHRVFKLAAEHSATRANRSPQRQRNSELTAHVRNTISDEFASGEFTIAAVLATLKENNPELNGSANRNSLGNVFRRLVEDREVEVAEPGAGRKPAKFRCLGLRRATAEMAAM